jgi:amidophosphoribosyltransferase
MELITRQIIQNLEGDNAEGSLDRYVSTDSKEYTAMVDAIAKKLNLTSLKFSTVEDLVESIGLPKCQVCTHCFDGSSKYTLEEINEQ